MFCKQDSNDKKNDLNDLNDLNDTYNSIITMSTLKAVSLFSGMGGDTLGMERAGVEVIAFNECNRPAIESHQANFPNSVLIGNSTNKNDITRIPDIDFLKYREVVDLIFAGFPCQGFSKGGKKLPDDPRNTLFREFVRVTDLLKPKYIIGENVDGLLNRKTDSGELFINVIVNEFTRIGYNINYEVMRAVDHGVPQVRKRLILVGVRNDLDVSYEFPEPIDAHLNLVNVVNFSMEGCISLDDEDYNMGSLPTECLVQDLSNDETESSTVHPYLRLKAKSRNQVYKDITHVSLLSFGKRASPIHAEIIDIRKPSKTIICSYDHQPRLFVPLQNKHGYYLRCLLPDELKQIQGFPANFHVCGNKKQQIQQIGNAVPPPLVERIVENLIILDASLSPPE